jgi:hypothetical protein
MGHYLFHCYLLSSHMALQGADQVRRLQDALADAEERAHDAARRLNVVEAR